MKNLSIVFFSLLTLSFAAHAYEQPENPFTVGGLIGVSTHELGATNNYIPQDKTRAAVYKNDRAKTVSLLLLGSYSILDSLLVEMQFVTSLGDEKVFGTVDTPSGSTTSMKVSNYAAGTYAVYKLGGDAYVKARLGLGFSSSKFETGNASQEFSDFGISYGISVGQKFGPGSLEFIYMRYPDIHTSQSKFSHRFDVQPIVPTDTGSSIDIRRRQKLQYFMIGYVYSF